VLDYLVNINLDEERSYSPMCRELQKVIWQIPEVSCEKPFHTPMKLTG